MDLNTGMSKSILTVIALAAILSLSLVGKVWAGDSNSDNVKGRPHIISSFPDAADHFKIKHDTNKDKDDTKCPVPDAGRCSQAIRATPTDDNNHHKANHKINEINSLFRSKGTTAATVSVTSSATTTVPNGLNATFFNASTLYCWYVVNAPPCYDLKTDTVIH